VLTIEQANKTRVRWARARCRVPLIVIATTFRSWQAPTRRAAKFRRVRFQRPINRSLHKKQAANQGKLRLKRNSLLRTLSLPSNWDSREKMLRLQGTRLLRPVSLRNRGAWSCLILGSGQHL
jgi:hypothetical protein